MKKDLSLGDLITAAQKAARESKFGFDTAICLCEQGREYVPFKDAVLDMDDDGAVFIISLHRLV